MSRFSVRFAAAFVVGVLSVMVGAAAAPADAAGSVLAGPPRCC
jgi:hypothetical protein